jgi:predicted phage terminase large subunit-like protein
VVSGAAYILKLPEGAERLVRAADCRHFITTDWAISEKKSADYTVFSLWALTPERDLILVSRFRDRIEEAEHIPSLQRFYDECTAAIAPAKIRLIAVERQSFGLSVIKNGRKTTSMPMMGMPADQDKVSRALPVAGFVREGHYYLPEHADWTEEWISEHTSFPTGKHDDQVDTSSYAALAVEKWFPGSWRTQAELDAEAEGQTVISEHIDRIAKRNAKARRRNPWR